MKHQPGILTLFLDALESMLLAIFLLPLLPFVIFNLKFWRRLGHRLKVLLPLGLFATSVRSLFDEFFGLSVRACSQLSHITAEIEDQYADEAERGEVPEVVILVLEELYNRLGALQLKRGLIEELAITVIKANSSCELLALESAPKFDFKMAQIVRAGVAASKILEENSSASIVFQAAPSFSRAKKANAKVIPFPRPLDG